MLICLGSRRSAPALAAYLRANAADEFQSAQWLDVEIIGSSLQALQQLVITIARTYHNDGEVHWGVLGAQLSNHLEEQQQCKRLLQEPEEPVDGGATLLAERVLWMG